MVPLSTARGWQWDVSRGPDWLFVRPVTRGWIADGSNAARAPERSVPAPVYTERNGDAPHARFADQIWSLLEQALLHRVVLDLTNVDSVDDALLDELALLEERILKHDGMMRICGLSTASQQRVAQRLAGQFSGFRDAEEAVMGLSRLKPR